VIYFKSAIVGLLTALLAIVIVTLAQVRLAYGQGTGTMSVSIAEWLILATGAIGFAVGFTWKVRRGRALRRA
jgi:hypothetical protein